MFNNAQDKKLQQKFLTILKEYCETFETVKLYPNGFFSIDSKSICLFSLLRKKDSVSRYFKELLFTIYIEENYYKSSKYTLCLRLILKFDHQVTNDIYKERIKYIELLSLKRLLKYEELKKAFSESRFSENRPINLMRKATIHYTVGEMKEAISLYLLASQQQSNIEVRSYAIHALKMLKIRSRNEDTIYKSLESINLKELERAFSNHTRNLTSKVSLKLAENKLIKYEQELSRAVFKRERELRRREEQNLFGYDNYLLDAYTSFLSYISLVERMGLPDRLITDNYVLRDAFQHFLNEGLYHTAFKFIVFGFSIKDFNINDSKLTRVDTPLISDLLSYIPKTLFLINTSHRRDYANLQSIYVLNLIEAILEQVVQILPDSYLIILKKYLFKILSLNIISINNSVHGKSHKLMANIINELPSKERLELIEEYLSFVINKDFDRYAELSRINLNVTKEDIENFNYSLLEKALKKIEDTQHIPIKGKDFIYFIIYINSVTPIPTDNRNNISTITLSIIDNTNIINDSDYFPLIRLLLALDVESFYTNLKHHLNKLVELYLTNISTSSSLGQPLFILAEALSHLSNTEIARITKKANEDLKRLKSDKRNDEMYANLVEIFEIAYMYWHTTISIEKQKPIFFNYAYKRIDSSTLYQIPIELLKEVRSKLTNLQAFVDEIQLLLSSSSEKERIPLLVFIRHWFSAADEFTESDIDLLKFLSHMLLDSSYSIRSWVLSIYTDIGSINAELISPYKLKLFRQASIIVDNSPQKNHLIAVAYLLKTFKDIFEVEHGPEYYKLLDKLKDVPYRAVQIELKEHH